MVSNATANDACADDNDVCGLIAHRVYHRVWGVFLLALILKSEHNQGILFNVIGGANGTYCGIRR